MPKISQRGVHMPPSPIRRLMPFADAAKAKGIKIFHLNIGQPDVESPPEFWHAVKNYGNKVLEYSHSAGTPALRNKARQFYRDRGIDLSENQLVVTTAGSEAIRFAVMACLDPGDEVIVPEPLYANYLGFSCEADVHVVPITTHIEKDFALPDAAEFAKRITAKTKAILVCNPSNPTGTIYDTTQLEELAEIARQHDLFLISDEAYREFNYTGEELRSILQFPGLERHAVMVDSVSKRFSLCGARVGFICSHNDEVMNAALRFSQARLSPPTLEQAGVEASLGVERRFFDDVREEFRSRRDLLASALSHMAGVTCPKIEGAFYAMVRLPIDDCDKFCQWLLEEFSHNGKTVMLAPGTGFYATEGLGKQEVRIAYVLNKGDLSLAMECLHVALATYPGRTVEQAATAAV